MDAIPETFLFRFCSFAILDNSFISFENFMFPILGSLRYILKSDFRSRYVSNLCKSAETLHNKNYLCLVFCLFTLGYGVQYD